MAAGAAGRGDGAARPAIFMAMFTSENRLLRIFVEIPAQHAQACAMTRSSGPCPAPLSADSRPGKLFLATRCVARLNDSALL
jgi:hypothetical protein